jgi:hypothetical protein
LADFAHFAAEHHKPLCIPESGTAFDDGHAITRLAEWVKTNNVIAWTYWESNDGSNNDRLVDSAKRQKAYVDALANTRYTGSYWQLIPLPATKYPGY